MFNFLKENDSLSSNKENIYKINNEAINLIVKFMQYNNIEVPF